MAEQGPISKAFVQILPESGSFEPALIRQVSSAVSNAARTVRGVLGRALGDLGAGGGAAFDAVNRGAETAAVGASRAFASAAASVNTSVAAMDDAAGPTFAHLAAEGASAATDIQRSFGGTAAFISNTLSNSLANAVTGITQRLRQSLTEGIVGAGSLEQLDVAFTGILGSAEAAGEAIDTLFKFTAVTPFEFEPVTVAARRFAGLGLSIEGVIDNLTAIGNVAATLGSSGESIDKVTIALARIQGSGRATVGDLELITDALPGFNAAAAIAAELGVSTAEAFKKLGEGGVPARTAIDGIIHGMERFPGAAGAMERQSLTLIGLWSTFKDTMQLALIEGVNPLIPALKTGLADALPVIERIISQLAPVLGDLATRSLPMFLRVADALPPVLEGVGNAILNIVGVAQPFLALIEALPPGFVAATTQAFVFNRVLGRLQGTLKGYVQAQAAAGALTVFGRAAQGASRALGPIGIGVAALSILWSSYSNRQREAEAAVSAMSAAITADTQALGANTGAIDENIAARGEQIGAAIEQRLGSKHIATLTRFGLTAEDVGAAIGGTDEDVLELIRSMTTFADGLGEGGNRAVKYSKSIEDLKDGLRDATDEIEHEGLVKALIALHEEYERGRVDAENRAKFQGDDAEATKNAAAAAEEQTAISAQQTAALNAVKDAVQTVTAAQEAHAKVAAEVAGEIADANDTATKAIASANEQLRVDLFRIDRQLEGAMRGVVDSFVSQIPSMAASVRTAIGAIDTEAGDEFDLPTVTAKMQEQLAKIDGFYKTVADLSARGLEDSVRVLLEQGPEAAGALAQALAGGTAEQQSAFEATAEALLANQQTAESVVRDAAANLPVVLAAGANAAVAAFESQFNMAAPAGASMEALKARIVRGFQETAASVRVEANETLGEAVRAAGEKLGESEAAIREATGRLGTAAGGALTAGISEAILEGIPGVLAALGDLSSLSVKKVNSDLAIRSPSHKFFDIGRQVPAGFAGGILAGIPEATRALGAMSAVPSFNTPAGTSGLPDGLTSALRQLAAGTGTGSLVAGDLKMTVVSGDPLTAGRDVVRQLRSQQSRFGGR